MRFIKLMLLILFSLIVIKSLSAGSSNQADKGANSTLTNSSKEIFFKLHCNM
ncbi:hypothetical protein [Arcobacter arenosus]|uniref:hypothetical protein n=1 Tax=Arcobacter arenosus TaxID=2576037 RepID=UPI0014857AFC|nr:hypothetical protein [Arcobacter arenosus]